MMVSILGCGWFGRAFAAALLAQGVLVKGSTTSPDKLAELAALGIEPYLINLAETTGGDGYASFFECDVLLVSIPPRIRQQTAGNFMEQIDRLIGYLKQYSIKQVIFISSTSVYSDNCGVVDERNEPLPNGDSGEVLLAAERLLHAQSLFQTTVVRFGGLIGPGRHPGRFFAGKKNIANGLAPVNLIHLTDCVGICTVIVNKQWYGYTLNACAPQHPTRKDFYTQATHDAGLESPEFVDECVASKVVKSIYVTPALGYVFQETIW